MELLLTLLALIGMHAVFVSAEFAFVKTAHADLTIQPEYFKSVISAAICRRLEDYLTVCTLAKTIILMSIGVLLGLFLSDLMNNELEGSAAAWKIWVQFGLGFGVILILQLIVGFEVPKVMAIRKARNYNNALGWHMIISGVILWPLLWLVNRANRFIYRFV